MAWGGGHVSRSQEGFLDTVARHSHPWIEGNDEAHCEVSDFGNADWIECHDYAL